MGRNSLRQSFAPFSLIKGLYLRGEKLLAKGKRGPAAFKRSLNWIESAFPLLTKV